MQGNKGLLGVRQDVYFFSGPVLISSAILGLYYLLTGFLEFDPKQTIGVLFIGYLLFLDQPHVVHSFARAFFDKREWSRKKYLSVPLLVICLIGVPICFYYGHEASVMDVVFYYGFIHVFKQNVFILNLYQQKSLSFFWDRLLEKSIFYTLFISWFFVQLFSLEEIEQYVLSQEVIEKVGDVLLYIGLGLLIIFLIRLIFKFANKDDIDWEKLTFFFAILINYTFLFSFVADYLEVSILLYLICDGAYHGIQKHGLMKLYFSKCYPAEPKKFQNWLIIGLIYTGIGLPIYYFLPKLGPWGEIAASAFIGVIIFHYLIEDLIWKVSKSPELRGMLDQS